MNAGAYGREMKDIVQSVKCVDYNGEEKEFSNSELAFSYRNSIFKKEEIQAKMEEYAKYRKEKQPIEYPSAGSTFKRGEDFITAKLIDEAGLKGYKIGGAEVSTKHGGFIINKEGATAKDVLTLVEYIQKTVYHKFQKEIELEIEIIGEKE